jgi:RNA polymerase sigma factor (sigma-70 family)
MLMADAPETAGADRYEDLDRREAMWQALQGLAPRMRAVLVLRYYEQLSEQEIADALRCSTGTVKSQAARGLSRLRGSLPADLVLSGRERPPVHFADATVPEERR